MEVKYFQHSTSGLTFRYPSTWHVSQEGAVISVFDPRHGAGALQFSVYRPPSIDESTLESMMHEFLDERTGVVSISKHGSMVYVSVVTRKREAWRYWMLQVGEDVVFATYNCDVRDQGREDQTIDKIVNSVLE